MNMMLNLIEIMVYFILKLQRIQQDIVQTIRIIAFGNSFHADIPINPGIYKPCV